VKLGTFIGAITERGIRHRVVTGPYSHSIQYMRLCMAMSVHPNWMTRDLSLPITCLHCIAKGGT
jgi:hypothetical protein